MPVNIGTARTRTLTNDQDGDGLPDTGDQYSYELIVTNSGDIAATNVTVEGTENGYTISNVLIGPIGINDVIGVTVAGNTPYTFNATDITGNDIDPDDGSPALTVTHINGTAITAGVPIDIGNGTVTDNGNGTFTFRPDAGFEGAVNFTYNTVDESGVASVAATPAQVTINVGDAVWYVDSTGGNDATGDGTYENPFASLNPITTGGTSDALDDAGDTIFVYANGANAYNSGIALEANQILRGEGVAADYVVNGITVSSAEIDTQIEFTTSGVTLASGNSILGVDLVGEATGAVAIVDNGASYGTLTVSNTEIAGQGRAVDLDTGGTATITLESIDVTGGSTGVLLNNFDASSFTVTGTTTINDVTLDGISVANSQGSTFNFNGETTIVNDAGGAGGDGVDLQSNNAGDSTFNFNGVDITVNGVNAYGFRAQSSGNVNILNPDGTNQITSNNGTALFVNPTQFQANLTSVTAGDGGTGDGIHLEGVTGTGVTIGSVNVTGVGGDGLDITNTTANITINGGAIGGNTAAADNNGIQVDINGGTGNVTIGATIGDASLGNDLLEISGRTTGTIDFNGGLTSTTGGGVDINGNSGGTIRFDGGMNLSTGGQIAFNATNGTGSTLVVTDTVSTANILSTTGATAALNVANTTIGAEDLTFQSISANGGTNGIVLNTTGTSGGLTITGTDGGDAGTVPDDATGGSILNTTGDGVLLTSTVDFTAGGLTINGADGAGIRGSSVNGFVLDNADILNSGNATSPDEAGIEMSNLSGTTSAGAHATEIRNSTISNSYEFEMQITNNSGTLTDFRVINSTISSNGATTQHGNLFNFLGVGSATMGLTVAGSSFTGSTTAGQLTGDAIFVDASGGTMTANIGTSTFNTNNVGVNFAAANNGNLTFNLHDNPVITGNRAVGVNLFTNANHTGTVHGTIDANVIGTQGVQASGALLGRGIQVSTEGGGTVTLLIEDNTVQSIGNPPPGTGFEGISITENVTVSTTNVTVRNNLIRDIPEDRGLVVQTTNGGTMNASVHGNTFTNVAGIPGDPNASAIRLNEGISGGTLNITQASAADVASLNGLPLIRVAVGGSPQFGQAAPPLPNLPMLADAAPLPEGDGSVPEIDDGTGGTDPIVDGPDDPADTGGDTGGDTGDGGTTPPPPPVVVDDPALSQAELDAMVDAAIDRWIAAGATAEQVAAMRATNFTVADMSGNYLAASQAGTVQVDSDGAGHGWFVDATPGDDAEYQGSGTVLTAVGGEAVGNMDLLTVLMHELGHQLGLDDIYNAAEVDELMYGYASLSTRRLPGADDLAGADLDHAGHEAFVVLTPTIATLPAGRAVRVTYTATVNDFQNQAIANPFSNNITVKGANFADVASANDFTTVDTLTLGGTIWNDNGAGGGTAANGVIDGTEAGVDGVTLTLFADTGTVAGVWDASDAQVATAVTAGGGLYSFTNLADGNYIVRVDLANFGALGVLNTLSASSTGAPDPDDNVDNDDNGSRASGDAAYSGAITLTYDGETTLDGTGKLDINTTLDFGFIAPNQPPVSANLNGDTATWTEGGTVVALDVAGNATITDSDSANFDGGTLTVDITGGEVSAQDVLSIAAVGGVTSDATTVSVGGVQIATYTGGSGGTPLVFTFDADATPAAVQALVRALQYSNTGGEDPTDGDRTLTWTLVDGDGTAGGGNDTLTVTTTVDVDSINDEPAGGDETIVVNEDDVHPFSLADFNFTDTDGDSLAEVVITTLPTDGKLYLNGTEITVAGTAVSAADITAGLLTFEPDANENGVAYASFTFQVRDTGGTDNGGVNTDQTPNTMTIDVTALNDAPVNTVGGTVNTTEDAVNVVLSTTGAEMSVSDVEATGVVVYSLHVTNGVLNIRTDVVGGITAANIQVLAGTGNGTGTINIQATIAQINATLAASSGLLYTPTANFNGNDTLDVYINDAGQTGLDTNPVSILDPVSDPDLGPITEEDVDTRTIVVAAVDDAAVAQNDAVATTENAVGAGSVFANNGAGADADVDGPALTVSAVNGSGASVGTQIALASGALLTLNADGTYSYDPNGAFDYLVTAATAAATGAVNATATDSFTYTLTGGNTATVTVTVNGVTSAGDELWGNAGNNTITGTAGIDYFDLSQGGNDTATGLGDNDAFYFGAAFTGADTVDGGAGNNDQIGLEGDYTGANALVLGATTIANVEVIGLLPGFDYDITTHDGNVPAGGELRIFGGNLGAGDNFTFDGSAETNGYFKVYCGLGTDLITTGAGNDGIYFGPGKFDPTVDRVNGGTGTNDQFALDGDYIGLTLDGTAIQNIDVITLLKGVPADLAQYTLFVADSLIGAGGTMTIWGCPVETSIVIDASAELDGSVKIFGGTVADTLIGGMGDDWFWGGLGGDTMAGIAGVDTFYYETVDQSSVTGGWDTISGFDDTIDKIDFETMGVASFATALTGSLDTATVGSQLQTAATTLGIDQALVFTATAGDLNGRTFLLIDGNNVAGYQANGDFLIEFTSPVGTIDNVGMFI